MVARFLGKDHRLPAAYRLPVCRWEADGKARPTCLPRGEVRRGRWTEQGRGHGDGSWGGYKQGRDTRYSTTPMGSTRPHPNRRQPEAGAESSPTPLFGGSPVRAPGLCLARCARHRSEPRRGSGREALSSGFVLPGFHCFFPCRERGGLPPLPHPQRPGLIRFAIPARRAPHPRNSHAMVAPVSCGFWSLPASPHGRGHPPGCRGQSPAC